MGTTLGTILNATNGRPPTPSLQQRWQRAQQWVQRNFADANVAINQISPEAEAAAATYRGRAGAAAQRVTDDLRPVYDALGRGTVTVDGQQRPVLDAFNGYIALNRYLEVAREKGSLTGGVNPSGSAQLMRQGPGGITSTVQAEQALTDLERQVGPQTWARFQQADALRQSALNRLLGDKVRTGFLTQETADWLRQTYPHYNPVTVLQALDQTAGPVAGNKLTQVGNTIKRLTEQGSPADQLPAMQSAALAIAQGQSNIMRNEALKTIVAAAKVPVRRAIGLQKGIDIASGDLSQIVAGLKGDQPGAVSFWRDGKRYLADLSSMPDVERALKAMDAQQLSMTGRVAQALNTPLRVGATLLSPPFILRNALFDAIDAWTRAGIRPTAIIRGYVAAATESPVYKAYIAHGGGMGGYLMRDSRLGGLLGEQPNVARAAQALEKQVRQSGGYVLSAPSEWARLAKDIATLEPVRRAGEIIELGPRVARFEQGLAKGESPQVATMAGRRITVDFSRMGDAMRDVNALVPFSNAALQGGLNIARSLRDSPAARLRLAALTTAVAGVYAWNRQFKEYDDVPDYVKASSLVVMLPGSVPNPLGPGYQQIHYVAIPLRELGALPSLITTALRAADDKNPRVGTALAAAFGAVNPVAGESVAFGSPLGAFGHEALQQAANYDFFRGRNIVSDSLANQPPALQYTPQTSEAAKALGARFNASPKRIDQAIGDLGGGLARTVTGAYDAARGKPSDQPPLVGAFIGGLNRTYGGQVEQDAYDRRDAGLAKLQADNRPLYEGFAQSGVTIQPPGSTLRYEGYAIPLTPDEELRYQQTRIDAIKTIFARNQGLEQRVLAMPLEQRHAALQEVEKAATQLATGTLLKAMGGPEAKRRILTAAAQPPKAPQQATLTQPFVAPAAR